MPYDLHSACQAERLLRAATMNGLCEQWSKEQHLRLPLCCAEPCNLRGDCQTNNTCYCTNGWKTCVPNDGTVTSASAGCETYVYGDPNNCGECGNVSSPEPCRCPP